MKIVSVHIHILWLKKGVFTPLWEELLKFSHLPTYPFADSESQPISLALQQQCWHPKFYLLSVIIWNNRYSCRKTYSRQTQWTKCLWRKRKIAQLPSNALAMLNLKHNPCIFSTMAHPNWVYQAWRASPHLRGPAGSWGSLALPRAQDSRSAPWVHQLLPHWCHSRASLQFTQLCPSQPWAHPSSAHLWAHDSSPTPGRFPYPGLGLSWCPPAALLWVRGGMGPTGLQPLGPPWGSSATTDTLATVALYM